MAKKIDLTNKDIAHLTVISYISQKIINNKIIDNLWLCKCVCGKEVIRGSSVLLKKKKNNISCGCKNYTTPHGNRKFKNPQLVSYNCLIKRYKNTCKRDGKDWALKENQAISLFKGNCFYCGLKPSNTYNVYKTKAGRYVSLNKAWIDKSEILFNGIDRLNNNIYYTLDNCVSCCAQCNFAKHEHSVENFFNWIQRVIDFNKMKCQMI